MYHYNFTNDLRISNLDSILKEAATAFLTDTVPSAADDKSKNNNYMTVGFYFNLKAKGNCAKLASKGNIKKVVLNFIKKFQFPNPRTNSDYENDITDKILLAPMRDIVKLLHVFSLIDKNIAYLTKDEIKNFIFYNDELAKRTNYNLLNTANQIIQYRINSTLPANIDTNESNHVWNQPERQIREMIKTLNYTGCFIEDENGIRLKTSDITRDNEADLFEIINCNSYWKGSSTEDYQKYMDEIEILEDDMQEKENKNTNESLNRIIFGAPGTGKSHKLKKESESFIKQKSIKTDITQQIKDEISAVIKLSGKLNFLGAIGIKYADHLKGKTRKQLSTEFNISSDELYIGSRAKDLAEKITVNEDEEDKEKQIKELVTKAKEGDNLLQNLMAIGIRFSDYLSENTMSDLKQTYELTSDAQMWWLYRGVQAIQVLNQEPNKMPIRYLERVTFHPNYSYAQFVGTYKPVKSTLNPEDITYEYVPGPFMKVYVNAKKNPDKKFLLLIEEINRANVAAVFGDVFQLLDRDKNGNSEYPISAIEDQKQYLESYGLKETELKIPSNMYIWATMNSADQGVLPMDAAFKRRWEFEYINIDDGEGELNGVTIPIPNGKNADDSIKYVSIEWNTIRTAINEQLKKVSGVNEDKLLGPFFIGDKAKIENAAKEPEQFCKSFKSKVLMYLFEDVVKMQPGELFDSKEGINIHYSDICKDFDSKGLKIFVKSVYEQFSEFANGDSE